MPEATPLDIYLANAEQPPEHPFTPEEKEVMDILIFAHNKALEKVLEEETKLISVN